MALLTAVRRGMGEGPPQSLYVNCPATYPGDWSTQAVCASENTRRVAQWYCEHGLTEDCIALGISPPVQSEVYQAGHQYIQDYLAGQQQQQQPPPPPTAVTYRVSVRNLSRANSDLSLRVGDRWQIEVQGAPNQPVAADASQNSRNLGRSTFGNTDSTGRFTLQGVMGAEHVGTWTESWFVGGASVGVLVFQVADPQTATPPPQPPPVQPPPQTLPPVDESGMPWYVRPGSWGTLLSEWASAKLSLGGVEVPYWLIGVGAAGAVWIVRGK